MSGKGPARLLAARRLAAGDAMITSPWFGPPRLGGRPWILTFVGTSESFVDVLFRGVDSTGAGFDAAAFPKLLAIRDFSEPPRALLDGAGAPTYARADIEPLESERPDAGEMEETFEAALSDAGIAVA